MPFVTPYESDVCPGIIGQQFGEDIGVVLLDDLFEETTLCTFVFEVCEMDNWVKEDVNQAVHDILKSKPEIAQENDFVQKLYSKYLGHPKSKDELVKIVLFSDLHVEFDYEAGTSTVCGKPTCCRADSGIPWHKNETAGPWGDYRCDVPEWTVKSMFQHIRDTIKPDIAFWGGDSISHHLESLDFKENVASMKKVSSLVFDGLQGIPLYAAIGNHDTYPQDSFRGHYPRENLAVNEWAPSFNGLFFTQEEQRTFQEYGYYSAPLRFANGSQVGSNHTRVISLNTNFCYQFNFEQMAQFYDPGEMLEWLEDVLADLERVGGAAILLMHVPNIDECTRQFGKRFHAIVDRYQTVIRWHMSAHIHQQQWQVVRDVYSKEPIGMNFVIGSVTTFENNLPSFDVIYLDPETLIPVEVETHAFELEYANKNNKPKWTKLWDYTEKFGLYDLSPWSFFDFAKKMQYDEEYAKVYRSFRYLDNRNSKSDPCDYDCMMWVYCQAVSNDYDEWQNCNNRNLIDVYSNSILVSLINYV